MIENFIFEGLFKILSHTFPKISKKMYPKDKFRGDIEIDVRSTNPISFSLTSNIPTLNLYIKITNKSPYLDIYFDRAIFSVWIRSKHGYQPVIEEGYFLRKEKIKRRETKELFCQMELKYSQVNFLKKIKEDKEISATLMFDTYIGSMIYQIKKEVNLENKQCKIE